MNKKRRALSFPVGSVFLFQVGCYVFTGAGLLNLDFACQFSIADKCGGYDHLEQAAKKTAAKLWAYDCDSLNAFFAAVEKVREFQGAVSLSAWQC